MVLADVSTRADEFVALFDLYRKRDLITRLQLSLIFVFPDFTTKGVSQLFRTDGSFNDFLERVILSGKTDLDTSDIGKRSTFFTSEEIPNFFTIANQIKFINYDVTNKIRKSRMNQTTESKNTGYITANIARVEKNTQMEKPNGF